MVRVKELRQILSGIPADFDTVWTSVEIDFNTKTVSFIADVSDEQDIDTDNRGFESGNLSGQWSLMDKTEKLSLRSDIINAETGTNDEKRMRFIPATHHWEESS